MKLAGELNECLKQQNALLQLFIALRNQHQQTIHTSPFTCKRLYSVRNVRKDTYNYGEHSSF